MKPKYNQQDIVTVPFPFDDLLKAKIRPSLVLSNTNISNKGKYILAAITSNPIIDNLSYNIKSSDIGIKLMKKSQVRCYKIFTVDEKLIIKKITTMNSKAFNQVIKKVKSYIE